ncbi:MAG: caa(3)-type oxidase subunit IV [bacterium]|nr:caa(3)-type oxidase subunit IV [bacterium]
MSDTTNDQAGHVASIPLLVGVLIALMVGTWLTVTATYFDLGALNIWIGLAIATAKAFLVAVYYMHLRWDRPINAIALLAAVLFLMLFLGIAMLDSSQYQPQLIPDYPIVP